MDITEKDQSEFMGATRARFEQWVKSRGGSVNKLGNGYVESMTELWWRAWEAASSMHLRLLKEHQIMLDILRHIKESMDHGSGYFSEETLHKEIEEIIADAQK